ncbi:transposase [Chryseobacterium sp. RRHN12]|uniref:transposase n=1 Tax=Chryseobacterium sp. RRHN12 TaxID=3437884 RepID=UPI003D9BD733
MENFKNIHIGEMIRKRVIECEVESSRICNFLNCSEKLIEEVYQSPSIDSEMLVRLSKLLEYDFFRIYTQHLLLYSPCSSNISKRIKKPSKTSLPVFRKKIYTPTIINFVTEEITSGRMTLARVIEIYRIPKTTLYKWMKKYAKNEK